jgi:hypothetical protein
MLATYARTSILRQSRSIVGACAIGAFDDELKAGLLKIDGVDEFVIYCATVGRKV